jgi:predicted nucleotidyltransferase
MIPASDPGKALSLVYTYVPKERILWFCDFGSRAYGTDGPDSDYDYRGIYIADPADVFACTYSAKDNVELHANAEGKKYDIGMWELKKVLEFTRQEQPQRH